ncbi:MAG TPA: ATP-dependent DNA helicase [Candidatus Lachnoclostridium stercorigallinarum]|uniref:ATP-dependent DNA helicase n=1 Tax=Candidatus Lachnoclostridium stercorigallinarum TaxID=2838634 RepID=A0A9D2K660_9FIRM|nr:ATP-dependent DNA helicase [Candidatus Lachnoclostridium stercorigallinarum]
MGAGEEKIITISVRNLVEFVLRSGDLDNRRTSSAEKDAMQAGSRIHRKIQKSMGAGYQAEVKLSCQMREGEFVFRVEGRADGILTEAGGVTIDEIKGVYRSLFRIEEPEPVHMAQAMCYAYFYSREKGLSSIGIQVTYCSLETEETRRFREEKSFEELEEWFRGLLHEYVKWARYLYSHGLKRDASIRDLPFPYPYREGQKELAVAVYRSIARKRNLYIQAPTGIGKTLAVIYPALKAVGEGLGEKIFYLTAKTITRTVAEETFHLLGEKGLYYTTVTVTAKEKLCVLEKPDCNPQACPRAAGHFDRVNDAVYDIIHQEREITRQVILEYAEKYQVCPFEFCLDITNWCDGIICDYNYVFDPNVRLKRYFAERAEGEYLFLVDEAHNLVSRAREMYSAALVKEDVLAARRLAKGKSPRLVKALDWCNRLMLEMKRECGEWEILESVAPLMQTVSGICGELEELLEEPAFDGREELLEFYFQVRDFSMIYELTDDCYRMYSQIREDGSFMVRLFCVDPSGNLSACLKQGNAAIFFSATLLPVNYYKELLSGNKEEYAVYANSPFKQENRLLIAASDVSSRYVRRNRSEYEKVAEYIRRITSGKAGNYMVFLPSYQYMDHVAEIFQEREQDFDWIRQKSRMGEREREEFLEQFELERSRPFVALCVMGGVFSEGIDLKAERLIGAVIVGTGLPQVNTEQEILKRYFDEKGRRGFDFAYQYPGMNKVLQAAGRVIRTGEDCGVIALLDERFLYAGSRSLFPREWNDCRVVNLENVEKTVKDFWAGREGVSEASP